MTYNEQPQNDNHAIRAGSGAGISFMMMMSEQNQRMYPTLTKTRVATDIGTRVAEKT